MAPMGVDDKQAADKAPEPKPEPKPAAPEPKPEPKDDGPKPLDNMSDDEFAKLREDLHRQWSEGPLETR